MVERLAVNEDVVGSSPTPGATFKRVFSLMAKLRSPKALMRVRFPQDVPLSNVPSVQIYLCI